MIWKPVLGWDGFYEVSDAGRLRSVDRVSVTSAGPRLYRGKLLANTPNKDGYIVHRLSCPSRQEYIYAHAAVLSAFIGPPPDGHEVCHNNGDRADNRLLNLRYGTRSENALDRHLHGTFDCVPTGSKCASAKLTETDVVWIRQNEGLLSYREMGRQLGVSHHTIIAAARGIFWSHVRFIRK